MGDSVNPVSVRAPSAPERCAHGVLKGQPCMSCLVSRADGLAERSPRLRSMLRESNGSRFQTVHIMGSSRAPAYADLLREVERVERSVADTIPAPAAVEVA